jgi:hypothetical protein
MVLDILARVAWNPAARRWYWLAGSGRSGFVAESVLTDELHRHLDASEQTLENLTRSLMSGAIDASQWEVAVAHEIGMAHRAYALFAAGGLDNMDPAMWGRIGGTLKAEYGYLRAFSQELMAGNLSEAQAVNRVKQYVGAAQQSYWRQWKQVKRKRIAWIVDPLAESCGDCLELGRNSPYEPDALPTEPGAGRTACHGNCRCRLEEVDD